MTKTLSFLLGSVLIVEGLLHLDRSLSKSIPLISEFARSYESIRSKFLYGSTDLYLFSVKNWLLSIILLITFGLVLFIVFRKCARWFEQLRSIIIGTKFDLNSYRFDFESFDADPIIKQECVNRYKHGFRTFMGKTPVNPPKNLYQRIKSRWEEKHKPFFISDHMR
ncbi:MAG: hypothetical protein KDD46_08750, partial [Bdellovibrionales bacterium]|nr:hypothetical protein [Bdellovibrionales bacterium]